MNTCFAQGATKICVNLSQVSSQKKTRLNSPYLNPFQWAVSKSLFVCLWQGLDWKIHAWKKPTHRTREPYCSQSLSHRRLICLEMNNTGIREVAHICLFIYCIGFSLVGCFFFFLSFFFFVYFCCCLFVIFCLFVCFQTSCFFPVEKHFEIKPCKCLKLHKNFLLYFTRRV